MKCHDRKTVIMKHVCKDMQGGPPSLQNWGCGQRKARQDWNEGSALGSAFGRWLGWVRQCYKLDTLRILLRGSGIACRLFNGFCMLLLVISSSKDLTYSKSNRFDADSHKLKYHKTLAHGTARLRFPSENLTQYNLCTLATNAEQASTCALCKRLLIENGKRRTHWDCRWG
jgi:hypothetical protein